MEKWEAAWGRDGDKQGDLVYGKWYKGKKIKEMKDIDEQIETRRVKKKKKKRNLLSMRKKLRAMKEKCDTILL